MGPADRVYLWFMPVLLLVIALGASRSSRLERPGAGAPAALVHRWLGELAEAVAAPGVTGGSRVAGVLRAQADHLSGGGALDGSPLAAVRGRRLLGMRL